MSTVVGKNTLILKELMGHAKLSPTELYCQPDAPDVMLPMPDLLGVVEKGWWKEKSAVSAAAS